MSSLIQLAHCKAGIKSQHSCAESYPLLWSLLEVTNFFLSSSLGTIVLAASPPAQTILVPSWQSQDLWLNGKFSWDQLWFQGGKWLVSHVHTGELHLSSCRALRSQKLTGGGLANLLLPNSCLKCYTGNFGSSFSCLCPFKFLLT